MEKNIKVYATLLGLALQAMAVINLDFQLSIAGYVMDCMLMALGFAMVMWGNFSK